MPEGNKKHVVRDSPDLDLEQDFEIRLKRAKEQLSLLREQEERLDRESKELEGLKTQTEELEADKKEIGAKLASSVAVLVREEEKAKKKQQEIIDTRKEFETLIREMRLVEKKGQKVTDIPKKIVIEREIVEKARESFDTAIRELDMLAREKTVSEEEELEYGREVFGMFEGFKAGIGFFLAGALVSSIVYVLFLIFRQ